MHDVLIFKILNCSPYLKKNITSVKYILIIIFISITCAQCDVCLSAITIKLVNALRHICLRFVIIYTNSNLLLMTIDLSAWLHYQYSIVACDLTIINQYWNKLQ